MAVVPGDNVGARRARHRPRDIRGDVLAVCRSEERVDDPGAVTGGEPGAARHGELGARQPGHGYRAEAALELGLDLGHEPVHDLGAPLDPTAGFSCRLSDPGLGHDDRHERLGADRRLRQDTLQVVVDRPRLHRAVGAAVPADPLVALGAVLGDGAHQQQNLVDQLRAPGLVDEVGQALGHPRAVVGPAHADAGVDDRRRRRPGARDVVLDQGYPRGVQTDGRPLVDLDAGQRPR
ncbi:MAG: hypothetical protein HHJ11_18790 [Phycicoccus sp.]|nr:hypothetical protein [Phycicoccus sp.]